MEEMQLGLELERELFLLSVVLGCGLGLLYDIFRVFRAALPHGKILTFFEDIIYTFLYGFALFTFCSGFSPVVKYITKRADGFRDCFVKKCKISSLRKKTSKST